MKFSDLNPKKPGGEKPKAPAAKPPSPAPRETPREEAPPPVVRFAQGPLKAEPSAPRVFPAREPAAPAAPSPAGRSRKEQQRDAEAKADELRRPFRELDIEAKELYARVIEASGDLLDQLDRAYVGKYEKIAKLSGHTALALAENPVVLSYTAFATGGNYLQAHSANVFILSQAMGATLKLGQDDLAMLGFCAMAHDIGMRSCMDLAGSARKLGEKEFARIMLHSAEGAEKMDRVIDMDFRIKDRAVKVISQVHERMDGSGYPGRLTGEEIDLFARIIGAADVFEAMSHPRPWREAYHAHDAVKHLVEKEGSEFDQKSVKALMGAVTLYPPGSLVCLSTGEIGRVVMPNKGSLTRPAVQTLLGSDYEPIAPQIVDLMKFPLTAVERIVELEEISGRNQQFAEKLEQGRWWAGW